MDNKVSKFFLTDKTFAIVFALTLAFAGWLAYESMVRENYPDLAIPQATIVTEWPGASASQIEKEITKPLEEEIRSIPRLKEFQSSSQNSYSIVTIEFEAEADLAPSMQLLRERISAAEAEFPQAAKKPEIEQVSVNDMPIMNLALFGDTSLYLLNEQADRLKRELEDVKGVRKVGMKGAQDNVVHIKLDSQMMRSLGLSVVDVRNRIVSANQDMSWGSLESDDNVFPLYLEGRITDLESLRTLIIYQRPGLSTIRLDDIADVYFGLKKRKGKTEISLAGETFKSAITLSIQKRPGEDTVVVIEAVRKYLDKYVNDASWPSNLTVLETRSEAESIIASFSEIQGSLLQGVAAVFLILLFALTWREATVAAFAMPITLLGALAIISVFGFTLNSLVMIGMVIALGLLVDVFILVMEGMHEQIYMKGQPFSVAANETFKLFILPATAGQLTTILAMVPLLVIGGIDGKFIKLIPLTAVACLIVSLLIAFLVCIPLSRYVFASQKVNAHQKTRIDVITEKYSEKLSAWLKSGPLKQKRSASLVVFVGLGFFLVSLTLMGELPTIVYPKEDKRPVGVTIELDPNSNLRDAIRIADIAGEALRQKPYFSYVVTHAGERSPFTQGSLQEYLQPDQSPYLVGVSALMTPRDQREKMGYLYLEDIRETLETAFKDEPSLTVRLSAEVGGASNEDPIQIQVFGEEISIVRQLATDIKNLIATVPQATDIRDNLGPLTTELRFDIDQRALASYGLNESDVVEQIRVATSQDEIGKFQMPGTRPDLDINLSISMPNRGLNTSEAALQNFYDLEALVIQTSHGQSVPLLSIANLRVESVANAYIHQNGVRAVNVQSRLADGITVGEVFEKILPKLKKQASEWPEGYSYDIGGEAESAEETYGATGNALVLAIFLIFAVLSLLFRSFIQPFIILMTAPLALTGMGFGFYILSIPISFPAMIGVIALIGIVVNDAIVMVEVMNKHRANGMDIAEAAAHGASDRLRPIITTSVTTIAGLTPLAFSSPSWYPLCMAVIWGLGFATIFALLVIPALYVLMTRNNDVENLAFEN